MSIKAQDKIISQCSSWNEFVAFQDAQLHTTGKGDLFERLVQLFLLTAPQYKSKLSNVWWPKFEKLPKGVSEYLNLTFPDEGIDLIAKTNDGGYWPIQAKYESNTAGAKQKRNLTTFSNAAFNYGENMHLGLVAHTKAKPIRKRKLLESEKKGNKIIELGLSYWLDLDEYDWSAIKQQTSGKTFRPDPRTPRDHQNVAIKKAKKHFIASKEDRGRLIMPCASGKSLTAYWIAKELKAKSVIVAVPSLSLIKQTVRDWTREYTADEFQPDWICICSDRSAGKLDDENDDFVKDIYDLGLPVTTDRDVISAFLKKESKSPKIIFITYMSSPILAEEAKIADCSIDFCIFDEAHKTAGRKDKRSTALLNQKNINIKKRLFMTATERILSGSGKNEKAYSMNDKSVYGGNFHTLTFKKAIDQKIICDYKIITMAVSKPEIDELIGEHKYVINEDGGKELLDAASLAAGVALDKTIKTFGAKHAISFHRSIDSAKHFNNQQALLTELDVVGSDVKYSHISSKLSTGERSQVMSDFVEADKSVMTNAKCLTEGVDIPAIDCVLFASPKHSIIDIVQAAGRAMRPDIDNGKKFGYILIPIVIPDNMKFEDFARTTEFKVVAKQLAALSSQDERIAEYFRLIDKGEKPTGNPLEIVGNVPVGMNINFNDFASAVETKLWEKIGKVNWRPFEEARELARGLNLKGESEWRKWSYSKARPADLPSNPHNIYPQWNGYGDWLGTGNIANRYKVFREFSEAREFARSLGFDTFTQWIEWSKSDQRPSDIPASPSQTYKDRGWINTYDWIGTDGISNSKRTFMDYHDAKKYISQFSFNSFEEYTVWARSDERPPEIPSNPQQVYKHLGWDGWTSWLNTNPRMRRDLKYKSFKDARNYVRDLNLKSPKGWMAYRDSDTLPLDIPRYPNLTYADSGWTNTYDWIGIDQIYQWSDFEEAREFARKLKLNSSAEWLVWAKSGRPKNIPANPSSVYKDLGWKGFPDWLGAGTIYHKDREYLPFEEAREYVRKLKLNSNKEWRVWSKSGRPKNIPANPDRSYKNKGWAGYIDFLKDDK
ncbi:DEAD/DEAH box helicase family protein [Pseudomonadales bacterium]|nr:DEAD/DEAH box helicase family protein [Pseudomonadales bacterium]